MNENNDNSKQIRQSDRSWQNSSANKTVEQSLMQLIISTMATSHTLNVALRHNNYHVYHMHKDSIQKSHMTLPDGNTTLHYIMLY